VSVQRSRCNPHSPFACRAAQRPPLSASKHGCTPQRAGRDADRAAQEGELLPKAPHELLGAAERGGQPGCEREAAASRVGAGARDARPAAEEGEGVVKVEVERRRQHLRAAPPASSLPPSPAGVRALFKAGALRPPRPAAAPRRVPVRHGQPCLVGRSDAAAHPPIREWRAAGCSDAARGRGGAGAREGRTRAKACRDVERRTATSRNT